MVGEQIEMPHAQFVAGLEFRRFVGESDFPAMISVIDAAKRADGVERTDTVADLATNYRHLVNCDPYRDVCIATVHGRVVGYSRVWWEKQEDGLVVYLSFGFLHPEWRRQGIGRDMLAWNQNRLKEIAASLPATERAVFRSMADGGEIGAKALLESDGYVPVTFGASMSRTLMGDLPELPLPAGLLVRPVESDHLRSIWEADATAFLDHWGSRPQTEIDWLRFLERPDTDPTLWRVAWEGDRVIGQVRSYIDPDENAEYQRLRGYTENISTAKEWRGQGVARALICQSMAALRERGMTEAALGVHTENPTGAFHLYSSLGYEVEATWTVYEKPF